LLKYLAYKESKKLSKMSKSNKHTVRLTDEQTERIKAIAYELSYVWTYRGETSGSITGLLVALSEGEVTATKEKISISYELTKKEK
jgi:hypothetical protein